MELRRNLNDETVMDQEDQLQGHLMPSGDEVAQAEEEVRKTNRQKRGHLAKN